MGVGTALVPSLVECNFQTPVREREVLVMVKLLGNRQGFWEPGSWVHLINKGFNPLLWTSYANLGMRKASNCEKTRRTSKSFCYSLFLFYYNRKLSSIFFGIRNLPPPPSILKGPAAVGPKSKCETLGRDHPWRLIQDQGQ